MSLGTWAKLCTGAGINVRNLQPMDVYQIAGKILSDTLLTERALQFREGAISGEGARERALAAMTPEERLALRERVTGVVPFRDRK
jgi:hypothetical protein